MMDELSTLFGFAAPCLVFAAFIALALLVVYFTRQQQVQKWGQFALDAGLTLVAPSWWAAPRIEGVYRGRRVAIYTFSRGVGRSRRTYTHLEVNVANPSNGRLRVTQEHLLSGIGKALGMQDIQVGDEAIDKKYVIQSAPPDLAARVLLSGAVYQPLTQGGMYLDFTLEGAAAFVNAHGLVTRPADLRMWVDFLVVMAEAHENVTGARGAF
jgi:hypothetical protein